MKLEVRYGTQSIVSKHCKHLFGHAEASILETENLGV